MEAEVFFAESGYSVNEILRAFDEYGLKMVIEERDREQYLNLGDIN